MSSSRPNVRRLCRVAQVLLVPAVVLATQTELNPTQPELERAAASIATVPDTLRATHLRLEAQDRRLSLLIWRLS